MMSAKSAEKKLEWLRNAIREAEASGAPIAADEAFNQLATKHLRGAERGLPVGLAALDPAKTK